MCRFLYNPVVAENMLQKSMGLVLPPNTVDFWPMSKIGMGGVAHTIQSYPHLGPHHPGVGLAP